MKTNLKNKRNEKGITLVALVVTIVVLLILAGVTIVTLFGESGVITAAQKAKNLTEAGVANDLAGLKKLEKDLEDSLDNIPKITKGEMVDKGTKYAKYTDSSWDEPAYIPGGYGVVQDSTTDTDNARKVNTIANGLVISDLAGDTLDNETIGGVRGNQFVWVPVPDIASMYDEVNNAGRLYYYGTKSSPKTVPEAIAYPTTKNSGYREPDVVTKASSGSDSWTGTSHDGDVANLNIITDFKVAEGQTKTAELFKKYLQDEFDKMIESVKRYKGFYIGRYETGNLSNTNSITVKAVVQKENNSISNVNWYNMYQETKNMTADNNNVTASMIWGCQWDRTLNWFIETKTPIAQIIDSRSWGNHKDSAFTYTNSSGEEKEKASGISTRLPTGSSKQNQKNHIYDMAGNVYECTMEASNIYYRNSRGGSYDNSDSHSSACCRFGNGPPYSYINQRFSLYTLYKSISQLN